MLEILVFILLVFIMRLIVEFIETKCNDKQKDNKQPFDDDPWFL